MSTGIEACVRTVLEAAHVDEGMAIDVMQQMLQEKDRLLAGINLDKVDLRLEELADGFGKVSEERALTEHRQTLRNIVAREQLDAQVDGLRQNGGLTYVHALESVLLGHHANFEGSRVSVATRRAELEQRWLGSVLSQVVGERPHVLKLIRRDKQFLNDVTTEMFHIDEGQLVTGNKDALWLAQVLSEVSDESRMRVQKAGADVKRLRNWVPQRHDVARIVKAGLDDWRDFVLKHDLLNLERTFPNLFENLPPDQVDVALKDALEQVYYKIVRGTDVATMMDWHSVVPLGPASLGLELAKQHRALFFKSADAWMEYANAFGTGNVFDSVTHHLRENATNAAAMEFMGPNPQGFMERYLQHLEKRIWDDPSLTDRQKKKQAGKLPKRLDKVNSPIAMAFNLVTGRADRPHNYLGAKVGAFARTWTSLAKLGMAVFSSVTDLSTAAARLRVQGMPLLEGYEGMIQGLFEGKLDHEKKEIAYLLGVGFDGLLGDIHARFMAEDQVHGKFSKAQQTFFKLSGLTDWTERNRTSFALMSSAHMAMRTKQEWAALSDPFRANLLQHGIDERTWEAVRGLEHRMADGRGYITPEAARFLEDDVVERYIEPELLKYAARIQDEVERHRISKKDASVVLAKRRETLRDTARMEIEDKLGAYFLDETNYGVIEPDERTRRWQTAGLQPGTVWGEVARFMMQFKSFPIAFTQRQFMAHLRGAPGGKVDIGGLAHLIASTTVLGYLAMTMKDLAKGREPRDITDPRAWGAAFMQGGGAGIYGDFILNKYDRFGSGPMKTIEGPVPNSMDDLGRMMVNTIHGDPPSAARAFHWAKNNAPFLNLWYTRLPLDYLILYNLQEMVSPGYLRRMERRLKKEHGQEMIFPPSTYIKHGGGLR